MSGQMLGQHSHAMLFAERANGVVRYRLRAPSGEESWADETALKTLRAEGRLAPGQRHPELRENEHFVGNFDILKRTFPTPWHAPLSNIRLGEVAYDIDGFTLIANERKQYRPFFVGQSDFAAYDRICVARFHADVRGTPIDYREATEREKHDSGYSQDEPTSRCMTLEMRGKGCIIMDTTDDKNFYVLRIATESCWQNLGVFRYLFRALCRRAVSVNMGLICTPLARHISNVVIYEVRLNPTLLFPYTLNLQQENVALIECPGFDPKNPHKMHDTPKST